MFEEGKSCQLGDPDPTISFYVDAFHIVYLSKENIEENSLYQYITFMAKNTTTD